MANSKIVLASILILGFVGGSVASNCYDGWIEIFGHGCYLFDTSGSTTNWNDAALTCLNQGAYLAEIESGEEQLEIFNRASFYGTIFWIGLTDAGHIGDFRWSYTGHSADYTSWADGEPGYESLIGNCAQLYDNGPVGNYNWADYPCEYSYGHPLCEMIGYQP